MSLVILFHFLCAQHVSNKSCRDNQNILFMFNNFFFLKSCLLCDKVEKCGVGQVKYDNMTGPMCIECWITEATNTLETCNTYVPVTVHRE